MNAFALRRALFVVAIVGLVAACGGSDSNDGGEVPGLGDNQSVDPGNGGDTGLDAGDIDLGEVPAAGLAVLEVGDEIFEASIVSCELNPAGDLPEIQLSATGEHDGQTIAFDAVGPLYVVEVTIDGELVYQSANVGTAMVSGRSLVFEGQFVWLDSDLGPQSGDGRLSATCT